MVESGIKENLPRAREHERRKVGGRRVDGLRLPAAADLLPHRLPAESLEGRDYGSPRFYLRISSVQLFIRYVDGYEATKCCFTP